MLENLPDAIGHALRDQRAGLDKLAMQKTPLRSGMAAITVSSLAFADHAPIPARYTADGEGASPPLLWHGVPAAAASVVLIVEDADAPTPQPLVHAIVVGLPPEDGSLAEGALSEDTSMAQAAAVASAGAVEAADSAAVMPAAPPAAAAASATAEPAAEVQLGRNSFLQQRWLPPDPPPGHGVHRYAFQLFALNAVPEFSAKPGRDEVLRALDAHAIASGCLIGTYERPDGSQRIDRRERVAERDPEARPAATLDPVPGVPAA